MTGKQCLTGNRFYNLVCQEYAGDMALDIHGDKEKNVLFSLDIFPLRVNVYFIRSFIKPMGNDELGERCTCGDFSQEKEEILAYRKN